MLLEPHRKTATSWVRRSLEWSLLLTGAFLLARTGIDLQRYSSFQHAALPVTSSVVNTQLDKQASDGNPRVLGILKIARLGLSAVIVEGDDEKSLALGVGHMTGTASIGSPGNAILAGHRDTAFWPLRNARVGDTIAVTAGRSYLFRVVKIRVVNPEDVSGLANSDTAKLTLISCYPFRHVGPAPQRIVLTAELVTS